MITIRKKVVKRLSFLFTPYKLFHSKDLLSHTCKVLVPFMVISRCEAPVKEGKSISKIIQTIWMYLMMRSKTCRVPWIKKHTAPAVNRDASSELPKTVHIFPEVKLHTFPEVYMFLCFFLNIFSKMLYRVSWKTSW